MVLVQYDSSDEDEEVQTPAEPQHPQKQTAQPVSLSTDATPSPVPTTAPAASASTEPQQQTLPLQLATAPAPGPQSGPQLGPVLGPIRPPPSATPSQLEDPDQQEEVDLSFLNADNPEDDTNPPSPYTKTRTLLHNLTLPAHPNMDIPPSPPGTPPPGHDALTSKFATFLQLKRTQGVHFNARLAASAGMRNPSVGDKLMGFIGLETDFQSSSSASEDALREDGGEGEAGGISKAVEQYSTVLSSDVWDGGASFPAWAYKGPLRRAQEKGARERERGRGEAVEFVKAGGGTPGVGGGSGAGSRAGTPGLGSGAGKRKGRWDT